MTLLHLLEAWFVLSLLVGTGLARILRHGNKVTEDLCGACQNEGWIWDVTRREACAHCLIGVTRHDTHEGSNYCCEIAPRLGVSSGTERPS